MRRNDHAEGRRQKLGRVRAIVRGEHADGSIVEVDFDINAIACVYSFQGTRYRCRSPQLDFRYVRNRSRGDPIEVYVEPDRPAEGEADVFGYRGRGMRVALRKRDGRRHQKN